MKATGTGLMLDRLFSVWALAAVGWMLAVSLGFAQGQPSAKPESAASEATSPPAAGTTSQEAESSSKIDEILEEEESVLATGRAAYDPGNRRDPFKSLVVTQKRLESRGPVPEGIAGLMIDELTLTGIFKTPRGYVAQVVTASGDRSKSYLLREGDQLYDGDVVSITLEEVVFKQIVNDPTALKPFREVVKKLRS
jgi:hypothetical protein